MSNRNADAINEVAQEMYLIAVEHGFHSGEDSSGVSVERMAKFCANLHGEVAELWEAARKGMLLKPCDKEGCLLSCAGEELADIVIRAMDTAVALNIDLGYAIEKKAAYNRARPFMHGKKA